jgi:hypothetical protein
MARPRKVRIGYKIVKKPRPRLFPRQLDTQKLDSWFNYYKIKANKRKLAELNELGERGYNVSYYGLKNKQGDVIKTRW